MQRVGSHCYKPESHGSLQLERSGDYDNGMSEVEPPGLLSYPHHQLCSSYESCFQSVSEADEGEIHQLEFGFRYHGVISVSMSQSL